jgi:hypothetical protein
VPQHNPLRQAPQRLLLPSYQPVVGNLPAFLTNVRCGFHYTEPWMAEEILHQDQQWSTRRGTQWGIYLAGSSLSPARADANTLLQTLFTGNRRKAPSLWAVLVYRTDPPSKSGMFTVPDPPAADVLFAPVGRSGLYPVSDYLLGVGWAVPPQTGVRWAWLTL